MEEASLHQSLSGIPLGGMRFFKQIGSTNDNALGWAAEGAPDNALVVAEEQTAGRGRGDRHWFTPPGAALAFSLVIRPDSGEMKSLLLFSILGGLAVCEALEKLGLRPQIKWPNDVLLARRKVCGVLTEATWLGDKAESVVLGIGLNVKPASVPPPEGLNFPATCVEAELAPDSPRLEREWLLRESLLSLLHWRTLVGSSLFMQSLEKRLAFRGDLVEIWMMDAFFRSGRVDGLEADGSLRLVSENEQYFTVHSGEVHLRPARDM